VLKGGRLIDPSQAIDRVTDIAFAGGKVAAIGDGWPAPRHAMSPARSSRPA
jgi:dihydroorotase